MTERPVQPADSADDAHIIQIREPQLGTLGNMNWRQNGGSRAMAAAIDRHAARLVFQSASVQIDSALSSGWRNGQGQPAEMSPRK